MQSLRQERDSLGPVRVPQTAYYGAQTMRAVENFPISGRRLPDVFIRAQGLVKWAAATANERVGHLPPPLASAIRQAALEVAAGRWNDQFVVDAFQAGAGTSQNMNANEVIANRANEILGQPLGSYRPVHPNDHVNMAQSTNDTIHVIAHVAALLLWHERLRPTLEDLARVLGEKREAFWDLIKIGRTHLQDAVPLRLGQEFGGYEGAVRLQLRHLDEAAERLLPIGLGGTAVGTGLNAHPRYAEEAVAALAEKTGFPFQLPDNFFTFQQNTEALLSFSSHLRDLAVTVGKIAGDIRLLSSGPRTGLAELTLPAVQPGSSIMPGKVNPVLPEMLGMVTAYVQGLDHAVAIATAGAQMELNVFMPVIAYSILSAIDLLSGGIAAFTDKALRGLTANPEQLTRFVEASTALATALNPRIGYEKAAEVAKTAYREGKPVRQVVVETGILSPEEADRILDPRRMVDPAEDP